MKKVKKAVIPAAGMGTRFLPATKNVPKELLPLVDKPIILYIVEEIVRAGIEELILVTNKNKPAIEDFFKASPALESHLRENKKSEALAIIENIKSMIHVIPVFQEQALGLGHAVGCAKDAVGDEPFAVLLGDELCLPAAGEANSTSQLTQFYNDTGVSHVQVMRVDKAEVKKYGIVECGHEHSEYPMSCFDIKSVVEKPQPEQAPSQLALPGRYVFDAKIFQYIEETKPGANGEIQLTDAMTELARHNGLRACELNCRRFDAGDKFGFLQANIELGLEHPETKDRLKEYLKKLAQDL